MRYWILLTVFVGMIFGACSTQDKQGDVLNATLSIEGMTCEMGCAKAIEENLRDLPGVSMAEVDFSNGEATLSFMDNEGLTKQAIIDEVEQTNGGKKYTVTNYITSLQTTNSSSSVEVDQEMTEENSTQMYLPRRISFPNIFQLLPIQ